MYTKGYNDTNKYSSKNNGKHIGCKLGFGWGAQRERLKSFLATSSGEVEGLAVREETRDRTKDT